MADVLFHPEALQEYQAEIAWYRRRSREAARRFVSDVERVVATISAHPDRYGWYQNPFREAALGRYPLSIIYRVEPSGNVLVVAVAHASREPGYWHDRA